MKKYVIELRPDCKMVQQICESDGKIILGTRGLNFLEELNADYINEHFGDLQDTAYQKGFDDAHRISEEEYQRGLEEGKKATWGLVADASSAEYHKGLNEAWEVAKKLFSTMAESDIERAFPTEWNNGGFNALINLQPQEAIEKLKAYEEKQKADDKIEVGDELEHTVSGYTSKAIFLEKIVDDEDWYKCLFWTGCGVAILSYPKSQFKRTGKHYGIDKILEAMKA